MEYDPIKRDLGNVFNKSPFRRKLFYKLLDLIMLRAWHIHRELLKLDVVETERRSHAIEFGARAVDEARSFRPFFPLGAPDRD